MYLVHHALSKHIEFKENQWSCISLAYIQKEKGVYFKRRNPYISACSLNVGYTKKLKVYYMNQNLTFNFPPEQMIKWKVAIYEMMKKNVVICPTTTHKYA